MKPFLTTGPQGIAINCGVFMLSHKPWLRLSSGLLRKPLVPQAVWSGMGRVLPMSLWAASQCEHFESNRLEVHCHDIFVKSSILRFKYVPRINLAISHILMMFCLVKQFLCIIEFFTQNKIMVMCQPTWYFVHPVHSWIIGIDKSSNEAPKNPFFDSSWCFRVTNLPIQVYHVQNLWTYEFPMSFGSWEITTAWCQLWIASIGRDPYMF